MATEKPMTTDDGAKGMNIRDHILAGHYPTDDKGRALVPTRGGGVATVTETNSPLTQPLMGWLSGEREGHDWYADGHWNNLRQPHRFDLLPPPPRKVKVTAHALVFNFNGRVLEVTSVSRIAETWRERGRMDGRVIVELTGEYDQGWD